MKLSDCDLIAFVATTDPERAGRFYRDLLGLALVSQSAFALVFEAHGTMLRVTTVDHLEPAPHTVLGWAVTNIAAAVDALTDSGAEFRRYAGLAQDARGVWRSPSGSCIAWFPDPDGNLLSLTQF